MPKTMPYSSLCAKLSKPSLAATVGGQAGTKSVFGMFSAFTEDLIVLSHSNAATESKWLFPLAHVPENSVLRFDKRTETRSAESLEILFGILPDTGYTESVWHAFNDPGDLHVYNIMHIYMNKYINIYYIYTCIHICISW